MCGIAGVACATGIELADLPAMGAAIAHRGPDGQGFLTLDDAPEPRMRIDQEQPPPARGATVGLVHRRLSIIDLSEASGQPMALPDGRLALVYNGELYNYLELRTELERLGHVFSTTGDTEVVLRAYREWGEDCLQRFVGMWAMAILDVGRGRLMLSRDRFGIKPLFYAVAGGTLYFASEIKALLAAGGVRPEPDETAVAGFMLGGWTDRGDGTFLNGIRRVPAAHNLTVGLGDPTRIHLSRYWDVDEAREAPADPVAALRERLEESIRLHARADVPIGTCLSGGIDSSGIVCLADRLRSRGEVPSYAHLGFGYVPDDERFSEQRYMASVSDRVDLEMTYVTPSLDLEGPLESIVRNQDEPFASASILAQWFVFGAAARAGLKVMLDGQGADELFAGYPSYIDFALGAALEERHLIQHAKLSRAYRRARGVRPHSMREMTSALAPHWLRSVRRRVASNRQIGPPVSDGERMMSQRLRSRLPETPANPRTLTAMLARETTSSSLPALLRYEDRNSMAHSIEARVPYLDHRIAELAFALPDEWKLRGMQTKHVLRTALRGVIPDSVAERPDKLGFKADPTLTWTLAQRHRAGLAASRTQAESDWFDASAVDDLLSRSSGSTQDEFLLWRVISLKLWARSIWGDGKLFS